MSDDEDYEIQLPSSVLPKIPPSPINRKTFVYGTSPPLLAAEDKLRVLKAVACGCEGVGKTSILTRFQDNTYSSNVAHTIGVQFVIHTMHALDGKSIKLQCWDTAGQDRFRSVVKNYFKGVHLLLFVYDVNNYSTFKELPAWIADAGWVNGKCAYSTHCIAYVIGNKVDMSAKHRQVDRAEAERFAKQHEMGYAEVSAQSGEHVKDTFALILEHACAYDKVVFHESNGKELLFGVSDTLEISNDNATVVDDGNVFIETKKRSGCCGRRRKHVIVI